MAMITVTLPNGAQLRQEAGCSGFDIAKAIGPSVLKKAVAVRVNGAQTVSLHQTFTADASVHIVTLDDDESLDIIRHSAAHIMAEAVRELFPEVMLGIGPTIKNGFYYDFDLAYSLGTEDLEIVERKMQEIVLRNHPIVPEFVSRDEAIILFTERGEKYKLEILSAIPAGQAITVYKQGAFVDLCKGPHVPYTGMVRFFKLLNLSGAYWRGNHNNTMLQRIYGTAWRSKKELEDHLFFLEEVSKRDHRKIGSQCDLFHFQEEAPGQVFWHSKGYVIYREVESYIRKKIADNGYQEVKTPLILNKNLWEKSGHWEKFREHMLLTESEKTEFAIKPMNCPCHVQIFNCHIVSYRNLPMRMAEFGTCHRNEPSGSLHGLMRVRGFTQDDAHIFCTPEQMESEISNFCHLLIAVYKDFGFHKIYIKFADRPDKRAGSDQVWDTAEKALRGAIDKIGLEYSLNKGEGAFYGPKLEFVLQDAIGRDWQCGTLQVDLVLPERLGAHYIGSDGQKHHPIMLHRAIIGTLERFIGILLEEHSGRMPLWLAPVQVMVLTIVSEVDDYAEEITSELIRCGIRAELDSTNQKIGYKVRKYSTEKIPLLAIIGVQEQQHAKVAYRKLGSNETLQSSLVEFINSIKQAINSKQQNI